ncbi:MAG TPA: hypothetical protein VK208_01200 [Pyrinomonadaceae bacterium]|jgi:hypothetical protein|nr:hypothetical protein [Pyrinomonadaceae bacterium]
MRDILKKLWPLAFCIAVTLGCNLAGRSEDRPSGDSGSSSKASDNDSGSLAGTTWKGSFKCNDGDEIQANYRFADSGNPIYDYQTSGGAREVELTSPGQTLRFVPPGGGVRNITLDDISVSPDHISHTMTISEERTSGGTLDQSHATISSEATLSDGGLDVEFTVRSQNTVSQPGIMVPGDESVVVCKGRLRR